MSVPTRAELRAHLCQARIAGDVATSRENNLRNFRRVVTGDDYAGFGLDLDPEWTFEEVLDVMVRRCGVSSDPGHDVGDDTIDPDLTLDGLDAAAEILTKAARTAARVIVATGHPAGLLPVHLAVAARLREAGCTLLTPAAGWQYEEWRRNREEVREIRYITDVAMVSNRGELCHTHSAYPMREMLASLRRSGETLPDLVVADHGWAGAAGLAGCTVVGFADCNDPALFLGAEEDKISVAIPLDDNVEPHLYGPMTAYLLDRAEI
ncbi:phosphatase [Sporichthya sp.]|uniref:phosphatase n=1 Tax=Sporichthya sp. TaxID=65475 RepID=UPI0017B5E54B|nr:phosphatase [Sporichthya sp.]MBA3743624.1 phosphatase [Sporichthya sp.]